MFTKYLSSLAIVGALLLIVRIDAQSNITGRVLDGTIETAIVATNPYVGPDGTTYEKGSIDQRRELTRTNLRRFCSAHLTFLGKSQEEVAACGYSGR